jgi:hypothetical protein
VNHISIDIETLDTKPSAVILSIGACIFNKDDLTVGFFHQRLPIEEQIKNGRTISAGTLEWWFDQLANGAPNPTSGDEPKSVRNTLLDFNKFMAAALAEGGTVWYRGPHFDYVLLDSLYQSANATNPVPFFKVRDQRTFCASEKYIILHDDTLAREKHNAVDDAIWQARHIIQVSKKYGIPIA